jgi:serine protease Do
MKAGDVILKLNGQKVTDVGELRNKIALTPPGTKVTFEILRDGKRKKLNIVIEEKPGTTAVSINRHDILKKIGLAVQELTPDLAQQFGYKEGQGVLIAEVEPGSAAASVGMRPGQLIIEVNRVRIHNMEEFLEALNRSRSRVLFRIKDGDFSRYVAIRLK